MKEIKFILLWFYITFWASSIWAAVWWHGLPTGPNNFQILTLLACALTFANLYWAFEYLKENWWK